MKWFCRIALMIGIIVFLRFVLTAHTSSSVTMEEERGRLLHQIASQRPFIARHGFNTHLCFLVDMRLPSGKNRFFVYDLDKDSILLAGLVAHGCGPHDF